LPSTSSGSVARLPTGASATMATRAAGARARRRSARAASARTSSALSAESGSCVSATMPCSSSTPPSASSGTSAASPPPAMALSVCTAVCTASAWRSVRRSSESTARASRGSSFASGCICHSACRARRGGGGDRRREEARRVDERDERAARHAVLEQHGAARVAHAQHLYSAERGGERLRVPRERVKRGAGGARKKSATRGTTGSKNVHSASLLAKPASAASRHVCVSFRYWSVRAGVAAPATMAA
jgi:hypothetical protein